MDLILTLVVLCVLPALWGAWITWRWWDRKDRGERRAQQIFGTPAPQVIDRLTAEQPVVLSRGEHF